ncbi:YbhB/YbcL family Raf kinase inhibitor-like protein [Halomarina rubra]|uniref:YbhB/YbcL family Raf kinase inhibitor-like protein n=1 Tax=Halomarina rubra TaxID=2071873 RepID=A0ABD6AXB1_9EURY|nr:YbhB/YbcL family Raf kinase inhibitor-like protein [Halomarina rubra]
MKRRAFLAATGGTVAALSGCTQTQAGGSAANAGGPEATVTFDVPAIDVNRFRTRYTQDGENVSPELIVVGTAASIQHLTVVMEDADTGDVHWTMWDVPVGIESIPEDVRKEPQVRLTEVDGEGEPPTVSQGQNYTGDVGYAGPNPPEGEEHVYRIRMAGTEQSLGVEPGAAPSAVREALSGRVVGESSLTGTYGGGEE